MKSELPPTASFGGTRFVRAGVVSLSMALVGAALVWACGGTTGRSGESGPPGASSGGMDATVDGPVPDLDAGLFDVGVLYADRDLPEVSVPLEGGAAGYPWPSCPPFQPVDPSGAPVPILRADYEAPTDYAGDGGAVLAADGSPCSTYPWLGSLAADQCVAANPPNPSADRGDVLLPPCNWCLDAGVAAQGTRSQDPRYTICLDLYACIRTSGCGSNPTSCLCGTEMAGKCAGDPNPTGPCAAQEMAALEEVPGATADALKNYYTTSSTTFLGFCAAQLNAVYAEGVSNQCFDDGGQ